ncbi:hypothetical protein HYW75_05815 [Candidatus Pacearchaeota archaeon]|nr:hypothetical protein [Candidatus Pacearchaeota archaeon]
MRNIISKAYSALDEAIMKGVNASVGAYNWTTGRTEADLANKLLTVAPILESSGLVYHGHFGIVIIPFCLYLSHRFQKINNEIEDLEIRSFEKSLLDFRVELHKNNCKLGGPMFALISSLYFLPHISKRDADHAIADYSIAFGTTLRSFSFYVIRADYFPPRKSAIKKGLEKLAEIVESYKAPSIQPLPAPV